MPGRRGYQWAWIEKPPLYWTIVARALWGHAATTAVLFFTAPLWARSMPDATHETEIRMGGHPYYLSLGIGWYINNCIWIAFGMLGFLGLIMLVHRDKVRRVR